MLYKQRKNQHGFTLVEILVVILLFAIFMGAVYGLYTTHLSTAFRQEEIVDVQQNLRIAMDAVTRDLQMAGFLVPATSKALNPAMSSYSSVALNLASASKLFTCLSEDKDTEATQSFGPLKVTSAADAARFENVSAVRIIRPLTCDEPYSITPANNLFRVISVDKAAATITLGKVDALGNPENMVAKPYRVGDVICKLDNTKSTLSPETVRYAVVRNDALCGSDQSCLSRQVNLNQASGHRQEIVAQNIVSLAVSYLVDDGTAEGKETGDLATLSIDDLDNLRAVRITITGSTMRQSAPGQTPSVRSISSIVRLRNRR